MARRSAQVPSRSAAAAWLDLKIAPVAACLAVFQGVLTELD